MAALSLAAPGTKAGPCKGSCKHTDCAQTRKDASRPCTICGKPIGYDQRFYSWEEDETGKLVSNWRHFICAVHKRDREILDKLFIRL